MLAVPELLDRVGLDAGDAGGAPAVAALAGGSGAVVYLLAARLLGLGEVRALVGAVTRRQRADGP
jgi:hypothetical protein